MRTRAGKGRYDEASELKVHLTSKYTFVHCLSPRDKMIDFLCCVFASSNVATAD